MITHLPNDIDVEDAVIGAILIDKKGLEKALPLLEPHHFYSPENEIIYQAIKNLSQGNKPVDMATVLDKTGKNYREKVMRVTTKASSSAHIEYHAAILIEKYIQRQILRECSHTIQQIYEGKDIFSVRASLLSEVESLNINLKKEPTTLSQAIAETLDNIRDIERSGDKVVGINTGFKDINHLLYGWQPGDLIVIAARPGTGKTALALNFAINIAKQGRGVGFFSLEMPTRQLSERVISSMSGVYLQYIRKASLDANHWKFINAEKWEYPIYIDDTGKPTVYDIKERARTFKRKYNIEAIIIDYIQLIKTLNKNRVTEVGEVTGELKALGKELGVPIIALAQLSREVEKRKGSPILSDLRESGSIEQDADIVGFLHCDRMFQENLISGAQEEIPEPIIEFIIAKHRGGALGTIELIFNKAQQKFRDYGAVN